MSNLSELFGGEGSNKSPITRLFYTSSGTFTAPHDMDITLCGVASGGGGAYSRSPSNAATEGNAAAGGGAGAFGVKRHSMLAGETLTMTVGAAAASASFPTGEFGHRDGNNGGDITITGPRISVVIGGGKGGKAGTGLVALQGGAGGEATGCDYAAAGGRGGNIAASASASACSKAAGGGAVNLFGLPCNGGDILSTTLSATQGQATGGGTPSGPAPAINQAATTAREGGTPARLQLTAFTGLLAAPLFGWFTKYYNIPGVGATTGVGGAGVPSGGDANVTIGTGGGGAIHTGATGVIGGQGGFFAGGGGGANPSGTSQDVYAIGGQGQWGGGGGGAAHRYLGTGYGGAGGAGFLVLEILA